MIHPHTYIHPNAKLATNVKVDPFTVIHHNVEIGEGTWIGSNVTIMEGARIGKNCRIFPGAVIAAIPQDLFESEFFGHVRGAFSGALNDRMGRFEVADGGTLFLDEVGELPLPLQGKLLRVLQDGEFERVGESVTRNVNVRVIAATNMPLEEKVADGTFREDLFYRLNVIRLRVPPLRERRSEIPPMVNYYANHYSARFHKSDITFTPQTVDLLMVCDWDGNVRQLCNEIQRIIARAVDGAVFECQQTQRGNDGHAEHLE